MNLNFGTNNYIVRYLQTFLKDNYTNELVVTGVFDQATQNALIGYLHLANTEDQFTVKEGLLENFPDLKRLFTIIENNDNLIFTSKVIDKETSDFVQIEIKNITEYLESMGWVISEYKNYINWSYDLNGDNSIDEMDATFLRNYLMGKASFTEDQKLQADFNNDGYISEKELKMLNDYLLENKLIISVASSGRKNHFPNKDMIPMINLFPGEFLYNRALRDDSGENEDFIHNDINKNHKVCIVECKPNTQYTIVHGSAEASRLVIGSYEGTETSINTSFGISSLKAINIIDDKFVSGSPYVYTTSDEARYLVIQCDSTMGYLEKAKAVTTTVMLGDINGDDKIDIYDKKILADYLNYPEGDPRRPVLTNKQKVAADIDGDGKITQNDMDILKKYLDKDHNATINCGKKINYTYYVAPDTKEEDRIARLLIVEGDITNEQTNETVQVPFQETQKGQIYGTVSEPNIVDWSKFEMKVELKDNDTDELIASKSFQGMQEYSFENLPRGTYKIIIETDNALDTVINNISVDRGYKSIVQNVNLILGDVYKVDGDGIDTMDLPLLNKHIGITITNDNKEAVGKFDLNEDGVIDSADRSLLKNNYGKNTEHHATFEWTPNMEELPIKETIVNMPVTKSKYGINFASFISDPWIVHDKFIPYLLEMAIHKYSRSEEITYVQDILKKLYPIEFSDCVAGFYSDKMRELVLRFQKEKYVLNSGDVDGDGRITIQDETIIREFLDGKRELSKEKQDILDTDGDTQVTENDYKNIKSYRYGATDILNTYTIPFYLGWVDVQTEQLMLREVYVDKNINEVGWR